MKYKIGQKLYSCLYSIGMTQEEAAEYGEEPEGPSVEIVVYQIKTIRRTTKSLPPMVYAAPTRYLKQKTRSGKVVAETWEKVPSWAMYRFPADKRLPKILSHTPAAAVREELARLRRTQSTAHRLETPQFQKMERLLKSRLTRELKKAAKHFVWATGRIESGPRVPSGAIHIGTGPKDWKNITVGARHAYDGTLYIGTVYDAHIAMACRCEKERALILCATKYPDDTPGEALERWLKWRKLGPYKNQKSHAPGGVSAP